MTRIDMTRIVVGIILAAAGIVLAVLGFDGAVIIGEFALIFFGTLLFALGFRHWWISRR